MSLIDNLLDYLRGDTKKTAVVAKERLQIILAHERAGRNASSPDYLPALQEELLAVIAKYIHVDRDMIKVQLEKHGEYDVLELNVMLPEEKR
jgi:cell division topological specificity factor